MNKQNQKSISEVVFEKIKTGEVKMKPKIYFILKTILIVLGVIVLVLFILYLISFILFTLRASGTWFLPGFGFSGMRVFLGSIPWVLILIAIVLIVALEVFAKRFAFVYRKPIFYSMVCIIIFVLLGSFIIDKTQFHSNLFWRAQGGGLPIMGKLYRDFNVTKFKDVHRGVIVEMIDQGFFLEKADGQILNIIIIPKTRFISGEAGDDVIVMGTRDNGTVRAFGVRKVDDNFNVFSPRRMRLK